MTKVEDKDLLKMHFWPMRLMEILTAVGAALGVLVSLISIISGRIIYDNFVGGLIETILYGLLGALIGFALPSVLEVLDWTWGKVIAVTDTVCDLLFSSWLGEASSVISKVLAVIAMIFTCYIWGAACVVISAIMYIGFLKEKKNGVFVADAIDIPVENSSDENTSSSKQNINPELLKRVDEKDTDAMRELAKIYIKTEGENGLEKAIALVGDAAELGNAEAMMELADIYRKIGRFEDVFKWYNNAAKKGNAAAMYNLSVCYRDGIGVAANKEMHTQWYNMAKNKGFPCK